MAIKKHIVIRWMLNILWISIGAGTLVLLVAAVQRKNAQQCKGVNVTIKGVNNNFFVDKKDVLDSLTALEGSDPIGKAMNSFDLRMMEMKLIKNVWVKKAELFFDNNNILQVKISEREPVARVFTTTGTTFYIDTSNAMLPLSEKFSARLPVFTGFPSDRKILSKADSSLLIDVKAISLALQNDPFCMALIDQVDITSHRTFEMIPKIGNNTIVFGDAIDIEAKLNKIKTFYEKVIVNSGWNYYSQINVQYKDQVVAKRRGADDKSVDSLRTVQMMQQIAINAERAANDSLQIIAADNDRNSTDVGLIQQSMQRDEADNGASDKINETWEPRPVVIKPTVTAPKPAAVVVKPVVKHVTPPVHKPVVVKPKVKVNEPKPYTQQPKTSSTIPKPDVQKPKAKAVQTTKPVQMGKPIKTNNDY